jgi:hypothetical protein
MKLLQLALERQDYNLAAYTLVYGLVRAKVERIKDGKKRSPKGQPERP